MNSRFAVIGHPIAHSRSPQIHAAFAAQFGRAIEYERVEAPLDGFAETLRMLILDGYAGVNVTLPFKLEALALSASASARAQQAGAANTLSFTHDRHERIRADNTDGVGLVRDLTEQLRISLRDRNVLLVGAGGAARGVLGALLAEAPRRLVVVNRSMDKATELANAFATHGNIEARSFADIGTDAFEVVINATSATVSGDALPLPATVFKKDSLAYDMMYGKAPSPFLMQAAATGARVSDGLGMLVEQAAEAFFIWHGMRPNTAPVLAFQREALAL
jgi:shikimate dehydrogenase